MSELGSAVEALRSESLPDLPDALVQESFCELQRVCDLLEVERLRRLAELERRRLFLQDGHLSAVSWLSSIHRMSWAAARDQVHLARSLEHMPHTLRALEEGAISMWGARVLVQAREVNPVSFALSESQLVEAARIHSMTDLRRVIAHWGQGVERELGTDGEEQLRARRSLHASVSFMGMVRVDGDLDPETGETLLTAMGAVLDAEARSGAEDLRTPTQRRADALGEICRQWLDRTDRPSVAGERPHLTVTVALGELEGSGGTGAAELDHTGPVGAQVARRLGCDASLMRVVMGSSSEPLDLGRRTPVVPAGIRRAVIVRDKACRFPGCERPHSWCDAHHIVHWADGGATSLENLLLLCRPHHRLVHARDGFSLGLEQGRPLFRRPDGSVLQERAPPRLEGGRRRGPKVSAAQR